jgi:hypothetical protein
MLNDAALMAFKQFINEGRKTHPNLTGRPPMLAHDSAGPQGAPLGHTSGKALAFRRDNADAMKGHDNVEPEAAPGPQVMIHTNAQEGTAAAGGPPPDEEAVDTRLHGGYRRAWKIGSRDSMTDKEVDVVRNPVAAGDNSETGMLEEGAESPSGIGKKLTDGGVKAGLHDAAKDEYGELLDSVMRETCNPALVAAFKAVCASMGFPDVDCEKLVTQALLARPGVPNYNGTGASAQDGEAGEQLQAFQKKVEQDAAHITERNASYAEQKAGCDEPPDFKGKPRPGGTMCGDRSLMARDAALRASNTVGWAFSSDAQPVKLPPRSADPHLATLQHLATRDDLPTAKKWALDALGTTKVDPYAKPSSVFAASGAAKIGWAA